MSDRRQIRNCLTSVPLSLPARIRQGFRLVPEPNHQLFVGKVAEIHLVRDLSLVTEEVHFASSHLDRIVHDLATVKILFHRQGCWTLFHRSPAKRNLDILDGRLDQVLAKTWYHATGLALIAAGLISGFLVLFLDQGAIALNPEPRYILGNC